MAKEPGRHFVLSDTASRDKKSGDYRAVIETPKGSAQKYDYVPNTPFFKILL